MTLKKTVIMAVALVLVSAIVAAQAMSNGRNPGSKKNQLEGGLDGTDDRSQQQDAASEIERAVISIVANSGSNSYSPNPIEIKAGETVLWVNDDSSRHTATSRDGGTERVEDTFDSGILRNGNSFSFTFEEEGEYHYFCLLHPRMVGTVIVTAGDD